MSDRVLIVGLGVTGGAVAARLEARGCAVTAIDDRPSDAARARAAAAGIVLHEQPSADELAELVATASHLMPSPGVPDDHPVFALAAARRVPVLSEFDLARHWDARPIVAVTGTNGKTTVTTMIAEMLAEADIPTLLAGNNELPLVDAIDDPEPEWFVVEASSFRLGHSRRFEPRVGLWLNFAPDHLDVHASLDRYEEAKARLFHDQTESDVAIINAADPVVVRHRPTRPEVLTFGTADADYRVVDEVLVAVDRELLPIRSLRRDLPHDRANALAASAAAMSAGAGIDAVRRVLTSFEGLPHRMQVVADHEGVRWFDDSKATTPHATIAAVSGLRDVVLIAGGQNKGLDLAGLGTLAGQVVAVVSIGAAAEEIEAAFPTGTTVRRAGSMDEAVAVAAGLARPGSSVLLSPACASFDWYANYGERGDDFQRAVRAHVEQQGPGRSQGARGEQGEHR